MAGHGYGGFWGEKNVLKYSEIFAWHIPHAHNGYLDLMLAVGVLGGILYVAWVVATAVVAGSRFESWGDAGNLFVVCLLVFSLVHAVTESKFPGAGIGAYFVLMAMATVAIRVPGRIHRRALLPLATSQPHAEEHQWEFHSERFARSQP